CASFVKRFSADVAVLVDNLQTHDGPAITVLFGPSGAGKTTALRCLAGIEKPDEGTISFRGEVWSDAAAGRFVPPRQRSVGFVPQDFALFPHLSVSKNIGFGLSLMPRAQRHSRVQEMIGWLVLEGLERRLPG